METRYTVALDFDMGPIRASLQSMDTTIRNVASGANRAFGDATRSLGDMATRITGIDVGRITQSMRDLSQEAEKAKDKFQGLTDAGKNIGEMGGNITDKVTKPLIGIGTAAVAAAVESDSALVRIKTGLGQTDKEAEKTMKSVQNLAKRGFDFDEATDAMVTVEQALGDLLDPSQAEDFTSEILAMSQAFGIDTKDAVNTASSMMRNFKITGQEATDIIAYGMQNGLDISGDFLDTLNEYAPQMSALGYSAEETLGIINAGMKDGSFNTDKLLDGLKEGRIRLSDMNDAAVEAVNGIGLNAKEVEKNIASGGKVASKQMAEVAQKVLDIKDPVEQNRVATELFGKMWVPN